MLFNRRMHEMKFVTTCGLILAIRLGEDEVMSRIDLNFGSLEERDRQYNARQSVPDFDACIERYRQSAQAVRATSNVLLDIQYGQGAAERLDIYLPDNPTAPVPVLVFIHGGYWRAQRKEEACIMAPTFNAAGIAVCCIEYTLMPEAHMSEIIRETRSAISWLYQHGASLGLDPERIHVSGSSAGGQLVGVLLEDTWQARYNVPQDTIKGALALSGLFDLQPLCGTIVNEWMQLTPDQAAKYSPLMHIPDQAPPILLAVGGLETDGFKRQTEAYLRALTAKGLRVEVIAAPQCNHFDLLCELESPASEMSQRLLNQITQAGFPHP